MVPGAPRVQGEVRAQLLKLSQPIISPTVLVNRFLPCMFNIFVPSIAIIDPIHTNISTIKQSAFPFALLS